MMGKYITAFLIALFALTLFAAEIPLEESVWEGQRGFSEWGMVVVDDSATGGIYAITRDFIPLPEGDFQFGAWCGTENVTTDSKVYLRLFDAQGNQVGHFGTEGANDADSKDHFVLLEKVVTAAERPAGAVQAKLLLQPATGPAEATGGAVFRNVFLSPFGRPPVLEGTVDWSDVSYFKTWDIDLQGVRKHGPFAERAGSSLEISWAVPKYPAALTFRSTTKLQQLVTLEVWDDVFQRYGRKLIVRPEIDGDVMTLDLKEVPIARKILLHFPQPLQIQSARFLVREAVEENWNARWIWFTAERVDHVSCWLRKEFELPEAPAEAWLQSCADDNGEIFINGESAGFAGSWKNPPVREVSKFLRKGRNVLAVQVSQNRYAAGVLAELDCRFANGTETKICSDGSWKWTREKPADDAWKASGFIGEGWKDALELFRPPQGDWGFVPYTMKARRIPIELAEDCVPEKLDFWRDYRWKFDLRCEKPLEGFRPVELVLSKGGVDFRRIPLGGLEDGATEAHFECDWRVGGHLYPGIYHLALSVPGCEVSTNGVPFDRDIEIVNASWHEPAYCQVAPGVFGQTTLFVKGEPTMPFLSILYPGEVNYPEASQSGKAGLKLIHVYGRLLNAPDGNYDFSFVDNVIYTALRGNPEAHLVLRITFRDSVNPEFYWEHPDELVMLDDGTRMRHPSLASKVWREEIRKMLTALVRHIQEGPYVDRVVGILPSEGEEGQWMHYWGGDDPAQPGTLTDYSPAMLNYFREWLARKYGTDEALQAAWGQPGVTLATAEIPSRAARVGHPEEGVFRKLPRDRAVIDYAEVLSDVVAEGVAEYCRVVKEASGGKMITGILYGHIMDLGGTFMAEQVGYLKLRKVIECPDLDFFAGPISYWSQFRDMGGPGAFDYPTPATLRLHNKFWINEVDLRTHLLDSTDHVSDVNTAKKTNEAIAREFALSLCSNAGLWLCNLAGGQRAWFDDAETADAIGRLQWPIAVNAPRQDLRSVAEVAVVFSDRSLAYLRPLATNAPRTQDGIMETLMVWQRLALRRLGAPFDAYLADDFLNPELPHYKFYVFMDTFYLTDEERAAIQKRLAEDNATALWFYAPGVIDGKILDSAKIAELTGISVTLDFATREAAGMVEAETGKPLNLPQQYSFLPAATPQVDEMTEVLAYKADGKTPAVVRKGKTYYSAYAGLTPEFLRKIAREAGVFLYSEDDDAIYVNASYLAVHTSKLPGPRTITLPPGVRAKLLWPTAPSVEPLPDSVLRFDSAEPHTRIWRLFK